MLTKVTLRSTTARSTKTSPQNITLQHRKVFGDSGFRISLFRKASFNVLKYPKNKLVCCFVVISLKTESLI